jgi:hypothetical protein
MYSHGKDPKKLFTEIYKQIDLDLEQKVPGATEMGTCCVAALVRREKSKKSIIFFTNKTHTKLKKNCFYKKKSCDS